MNRKTKIIIALIVGFLACLSSYFEGRRDMKKKLSKKIETIEVHDTTIKHDTIRIDNLIEVDRKIIDTLYLAVADTIQVHDTTFITLYKEVKVYEDSLFRAQISGIEPSLDWIEVFPRTTTITNVTTAYKPAKWGIGVQVGYGVSVQGLTPYIGIGVSYNLFSW